MLDEELSENAATRSSIDRSNTRHSPEGCEGLLVLSLDAFHTDNEHYSPICNINACMSSNSECTIQTMCEEIFTHIIYFIKLLLDIHVYCIYSNKSMFITARIKTIA